MFIVGTSGALDPTLKVGDVLTFGSAIHSRAYLGGDESKLYSKEKIFFGPRSAKAPRLVTSPVFCGKEEKASLANYGDAVDMETFFVAAVMKNNGYNPTVVRAISDSRYDSGSFSSFEENLDFAAKKLAKFLSPKLKGFR